MPRRPRADCDFRRRDEAGRDCTPRSNERSRPRVLQASIRGGPDFLFLRAANRFASKNYAERVAKAVELQQDNHLLREQLRNKAGFGGLIGLSSKMQTVYKITEKVSQHEYPILILGESGTGKEMVARSIHFSGPRKDRPFAPVDCSSLVSTLIESVLGYVKGAFAGAVLPKRGLLEAAEGGTLFLDEIGDMPVDLQARLLRALQERQIRPRLDRNAENKYPGLSQPPIGIWKSRFGQGRSARTCTSD